MKSHEPQPYAPSLNLAKLPRFTNGTDMYGYLRRTRFNPFDRRLDDDLQRLCAAQSPEVRQQFIYAVRGRFRQGEKAFEICDRLRTLYMSSDDYENSMADHSSSAWLRRSDMDASTLKRVIERRQGFRYLDNIFSGSRYVPPAEGEEPRMEHAVTECLRYCLKSLAADEGQFVQAHLGHDSASASPVLLERGTVNTSLVMRLLAERGEGGKSLVIKL